jgi:hypothetical protein
MTMKEHLKPGLKPRKTRYDRGTIKANDRDILLLTWIADQYAARFDTIVELARCYPGPGANPNGLSVSAVRQVVDRWRRAGWVAHRQILAGEPPWVWLSRAGLAALGFTQYKAAPPALNRIRHIHAINCVRIDIQDEGEQWISERMIRAGMVALPQLEEETRHVPDAILVTPAGQIAIEVELTQKKPDELAHKLQALINAWDREAFTYAYTGIYYFTPDRRIVKALEMARTVYTNRHQKRAELIQIELLEV